MNILDVPFHSSGATSRSHYAIVRRVETAKDVPTADQHIFLEIKAVQNKLHLGVSMDRCKECLLILLYCATSVSPGYLPRGAFGFAFRHAINLAEAGQTIEDRRIGYLFCSEMIPMDHDLRLMLVNTLRKDLESKSIARICMALDSVIVSPSTTVVPIAQPLLYDLSSHCNPHVKKRAVFALRALSECEPALFDRIQKTMIDQLDNDDDSVANVTFALLSDYPPQDAFTHSRATNKTNEILKTRFNNGANTGLILRCLKAIRTLGLASSTVSLLYEIIQKYSHPTESKLLSRAVILEAFQTLRQLDADTIASAEEVTSFSCIHSIKHFLTSGIINDIYLFMSCLECVDPKNWAGIEAKRPPVLHPEDFERILQQLHSQDQQISRKTIRVVGKVDSSLLDMQLLLLSQISAKGTMNSKDIGTLLDIILIRHDGDGGKYAAHVLELAENADKAASKLRVSRNFVERVLTDVQTSQHIGFKKSAISHFVQALIEPDAPLSPTALVISSALTREFLGFLSFTPEDILEGMARRLNTCSIIVQEPLLVAMLHVSAHCNRITPEILKVVEEMSKTGPQSVRARCIQFVAYSQKKEGLVQISLQSASASGSVHGRSSTTTTESLPKVLPVSSGISSQPGSPTITTGPPLIDLQISRVDHLSPEAAVQIGSLVGTEEMTSFKNIWTALEGHYDMRGWSKNSITEITMLLKQFTHGLQLKTILASLQTFQGEVDFLILSSHDNKYGIKAALRLQESEDSSCLWRLRCSDELLGTKVQRILNRD